MFESSRRLHDLKGTQIHKMPGIVGLMTEMPATRARPELARMLESVKHESFYSTGTWSDESLGVYVGWVAHKGSFSDTKPLCNERGDTVLVFSGEEYPEPGTVRRLRERGHALEDDGSSYLVHLCEEDPTFPATLNGRFHGVVIDRKRGTATLFNDRYGMHRVYCHESKDAFYFAAEAKAILAVRPELRKADPRGLSELVACGCVLENRTVFDRLSVLPGASAWTFRSGSIERRGAYFDPNEWEQQALGDPETYYRDLRQVFSQNVSRYFNGHERVGVALTGGLDTRLILAWQRPAKGSLPCYTYGSMFHENQDVQMARRVAEVCQQSHETILTGTDFLSRFAHYAERSVYLTDGCTDVTKAPDLYVSERARQVAPVKVVGTYGSEVLALAPAFKPVRPLEGLLSPELMDGVRKTTATYGELRREHPVTFAVFRQSPWWHHGVLALEETQLTVRSPYLDNDFIKTVYRAPTSIGTTRDVRLRMIADGSPDLATLRTDRGVGGDRGPISSALSRALLEFTFKAEYAYDYAMPQWLAQIDSVFSPLHVERLFLGRHKVFHFRVWYRDALAEYVREMLLDSRTLSRPYLNRQTVETVVNGHLRGSRNYTSEISKLLTLELLHRTFFD